MFINFLVTNTNWSLFMKYLLFSICFLSFIIAEDNTAYLKVEGMQCSYSCAGKVSTVVQKIEGVKDCSVNFSKELLRLFMMTKSLNQMILFLHCKLTLHM
ncbi:MAG: cation transporter [Candidatus Neomarinimicrobiota bacterium]